MSSELSTYEQACLAVIRANGGTVYRVGKEGDPDSLWHWTYNGWGSGMGHATEGKAAVCANQYGEAEAEAWESFDAERI